MLLTIRLWIYPKNWPVMVFAAYDLVGAYLMPANAVLLMVVIWDPLFQIINQQYNVSYLTGSGIVFWWLVIQIIVIATTKMDSSDTFYVLSTFITGALMAASLYFLLVVQLFPIYYDFVVAYPNGDYPLFILTALFPIIYILVSIPSPPMFFSSAFYFLMFPTVSITLPLYSFFHLDDFSWGNR